MDVLSGNAVNKLRWADPGGLVGRWWRRLRLVVLVRGRSSGGQQEVGMRCRTGVAPGPRGGGLRRCGLRLNKKKTRGKRVPSLGGGDMVPGCLLGVMAAMRTAVGRPFVAPPGKISGPICSTWKGRLCFCFWFFVCFVSGTARRSDRGSDDDCCFLFSECSPSEAARRYERGSDDGCCFLFSECSPSEAARSVVSCGDTGGRE